MYAVFRCFLLVCYEACCAVFLYHLSVFGRSKFVPLICYKSALQPVVYGPLAVRGGASGGT